MQTLATSELSNAEIIVIAPCGFSIERTASEVAGLNLLQSAEWQGLDAVKRGRVYVADGNLYFNRSSCGVVETAEMVAEMARPDLKGLWGHHGKHWVALDELEAFCGREGRATADEARRRRGRGARPSGASRRAGSHAEVRAAGEARRAPSRAPPRGQVRRGVRDELDGQPGADRLGGQVCDGGAEQRGLRRARRRGERGEVAEVAALNGKRQVEVRVLDLTFAFELSAAGSECATEGARRVLSSRF